METWDIKKNRNELKENCLQKQSRHNVYQFENQKLYFFHVSLCVRQSFKTYETTMVWLFEK